MELNNRLEKSNFESMSKFELVQLLNELREAKDLQDKFLLNISHDLRNPINVILSVLQCLKYDDNNDKKLVDKRKEYRDIIRRNSLKIVKLIDNIIDSSKLEKNYYNLKRSNIEIISMLENTVTSVEKYAEEKGIRIIFDTNVEEFICAVDPEAIDRIVMNLLSNAIKFSPSESQILVSVFIDEKEISISVQDEGEGISEEDQKVIFNRFVQATKRKNNEHSGSGIGLDLVNYLSVAHGGKVSLYSKEGEGSRFDVKLPILLLEDEEINYELGGRSKVEQLEVEFSDIYL
ncbi:MULTISPECIES: HAMP domain-containing sensor histidine kinase [Clostridium]|uniref:histidine kinase n=1 Tax=Clostridium cibarium TaxID=2762247 RepID=A0ABR8PRQ8_9CLOT|nr:MULTISPECIES: HAMP domain-containing sensor histidine kinase [Clostridium]MBD7910858.1 HAMP domain-containing histidine kinase [Clostridium cibarium]